MVGEPTTEQAKRIHKARYSSVPMVKLRGARYTLKRGAHGYPDSLMNVPDPPETLYVLGSLDALCDGLAVVGARKATPYGMSAAEKFAGLAAARGGPNYLWRRSWLRFPCSSGSAFCWGTDGGGTGRRLRYAVPSS